MSRFVRLALAGAALTAPIGAYALVVRPWMRHWGFDHTEAATLFPGDELIPEASGQDTRGITIAAAPEDVWPWLVQMGFGRGGWYSIDQLDMRGKSANRIVDEWQALAVGDVVPTHPGGGFAVKVLEPGRALVLYANSATMQPPDVATPDKVPTGLAASGAFMSATPSEFAASWSFVLEPIDARRTRLIERVRYWSAEGNLVSNVALRMLGFGVFVMMQRQMLGIRSRAERLALEQDLAHSAEPVRSNGNGQLAELPDTVIATAGPA